MILSGKVVWCDTAPWRQRHRQRLARCLLPRPPCCRNMANLCSILQVWPHPCTILAMLWSILVGHHIKASIAGMCESQPGSAKVLLEHLFL